MKKQTELFAPSTVNSYNMYPFSSSTDSDKVTIALTGSILDQDIAESIEEAYNKIGASKLINLLRAL